MIKLVEFIGKVSLFGLQVVVDFYRSPFEADQIIRQLAEAGSKSLPLPFHLHSLAQVPGTN